jgi:hypothetical protein
MQYGPIPTQVLRKMVFCEVLYFLECTNVTTAGFIISILHDVNFPTANDK